MRYSKAIASELRTILNASLIVLGLSVIGCGEVTTTGATDDFGSARTSATKSTESVSIVVTEWRGENRGQSKAAVAILNSPTGKTSSGRLDVSDFRLAAPPTIVREASPIATLNPITFGATGERATKNGFTTAVFSVKSQRIMTTKQDGSNVELHAVYEANRDRPRVVGFMTFIDGQLRRTSDLSYDGDSRKPL